MKLTDGGGGTYVGPEKMANEIIYNQIYTIPDFHEEKEAVIFFRVAASFHEL